MIELDRIINLPILLSKNSFFLFGPRGVGKSFLIRKTLAKDTLVINLLKTSLQLRLTNNPSELEEIIDEVSPTPAYIVIDEVQKIPIFLDEVHRLIEERGLIFLLTVSSARRLKMEGVNLLAGRAWIANLFPLTYREIGLKNFNLNRYLQFGGLPAVWQSEFPEEQLDAYVQVYLNEEVKAESAVRKMPAFVEFLRSSALSNGQVLNYAKLESDAGVSIPTIASYYKILEDTLLGFAVSSWRKSTSRKAITKSKFYFFDPGVVNTLTGTESIDRNSNIYGNLFEQFIAMELRAYISYRRLKNQLQFWRTEDQVEVDFIIGGKLAIEVKTTKKISADDLKGLKTLAKEGLVKKYVVVSHDPIDRKTGEFYLYHWKTFLKKLWDDELL